MATKVFVGNLSFSYTDTDLEKEFEHIGEVSGAQIIMQGRRSLGYGFVEFAQPEDAKKAVTEMNKKELGGREVNVEFAKPPPERSTEDGEKGERRRPRRNRGRGRDGDRDDGDRDGGRAYRPKRDGNRGRGRDGARDGGRDNGRRDGGARDSGERRNTRNTEGDSRPRRNRGRGKGRRAQRDEERPESTTLLFVANLPWEYENEDLEKLFEGLNVKEAHVVKTPTGRSRGYGFVEFEDQEAQLAAKEKVDGVEVDGKNGVRSISVSIALQGNESKKEEKDEESKEDAEGATEEGEEEKADEVADSGEDTEKTEEADNAAENDANDAENNAENDAEKPAEPVEETPITEEAPEGEATAEPES